MYKVYNYLYAGLLSLYINYSVSQYPALEFISYRESRNTYNAVNLNFNGTRDWGKYQINDVAFIELYQHKGLIIPNKLAFLNNPLMQEYYANKLMERNCDILKMYGIECNYDNQLRSWAGVYYLIKT